MQVVKNFSLNIILFLIALISLSSFSCQQKPELPELFPIRQNDKWGFINRKGEIIIQPKFGWAWFFSEGLAVACLEFDDKCGFIDKKGDFIIQPQFKNAQRFSNGLAVVQVEDKIGYIDKIGKIVISPQSQNDKQEFSWLFTFSEGLAPIKIGEKFGFIDKTGKTVIAPQFDSVSPFIDGLAVAAINKKFGFIDKEGKFIIEPQFDDVEPFANSFAVIKIGEKFGYVEKTGRIVILPQFDAAFPFSNEGVAMVVSNKKIGLINKSGSFEINPEFTGNPPPWIFTPLVTFNIGIVSFSEGLTPVADESGKFGYIDRTGKYVINPQFSHAYPFYNGIALVNLSNVINSEDQEMTWIDKEGKVIWREVKPKATPTPITVSNMAANKSSSVNSTTTPNINSNVSTSNLSGKTGYLITDANLRREPNKDSASVGIHFRNAKVQVLDEKRYEREGKVVTWYKIRVVEYGRSADANITSRKNSDSDEDEGWVNSNLVSSN